MTTTATLRIDGREVAIDGARNLLDLVREHGATVPSLCYDERMKGAGSCRVCTVKVGGRLVASCTVTPTAGMEVTTDDAELAELRRGVVELALSTIPDGDCPACRATPETGRCEMHRVASQVAARGGRYAGPHAGSFKEDVNPFLGRDYERCIHCYRCVRMCDEVEGDTALAVQGRGFGSAIATWFDRGLEDSSCEFCGQCIHTCPTGALFDKKRLERTPADLRPEEISTTDSTCPYCGTGCGVTIATARGKLLGVLPQYHAGSSEGALCVKGQFGTDFVESPDRLTHPLIRQDDGSFRRASWDEALDLVASHLRKVRDEHGGDAFAGWASARTTSESNYVFMKLVRGVMGTNNVDNCQRT